MRNRKLILIPFNLPWNWSTDYTNQTAFELAKNHTVICYMWADSLTFKEYLILKRMPFIIKKYSDNIYIFNPILYLPFRRLEKIVMLNERINMAMINLLVILLSFKNKYEKKILWFFDPQTAYLTKYFDKRWVRIYDCVDYFSGAYKNENEKEKFLEKEKELTKISDFVFANSQVLKRHLKHFRKNINLVSQGFRLKEFANLKGSKSIILKKPGRPLIGLIGAVNGRLNYKLIYEVAIKNKMWDFAIWGPVLEENTFTPKQKDYLNKLTKLPNVIRGKSEKRDVPNIIRQFDIGMIPYEEDNMFNKYCYPMKIFELFYMGKPVISTEISELHRFPKLVFFGSTEKEWSGHINNILSGEWPHSNKILSEKLAAENSWENKVKSILKIIK